MKKLTVLLSLVATPALAAGDKPFFSLANTDFVVTLGLIVFIGILVYAKVPGMITGALDKRADDIKAELEEAKTLRDEAKALLATFERKHKDVQTQADAIVASAKEEAEAAAEQAKADIAKSVERRLASAQEQIASAQAAAVRSVKDEAVMVAVAAAQDIISKDMGADRASSLIDDAIAEVDAKLH